jgi:hypothetical protein
VRTYLSHVVETTNPAPDISAETLNLIYDSLVAGLDDYSTDARGDVGSWVRIACLRGLTDVTALLVEKATSIPDFNSYLPPSKLHVAVAQILKQGVERLDNVRQAAGECLARILELPLPAVPNAESWSLPGSSLLKELFSG